MIYSHGGDIYSHNQEIIDLSSNVSPFGLSPFIKDKLIELVNNTSVLTAYPDPFCNNLRDNLSASEGIHKDNIVCGNGAAELIYNICQLIKPNKALVAAPTFSEYENAVKSCGGDVEYYYTKRDNSFDVSEDILKYIKGNDIVFICNPNNPTGRLIPFEFICEIVSECKRQDAVIVIDECFMDFVEGGKSAVELVKTYDNVVVLKAFTKMYAMAGLRLGYMVCSKDIAEGIYTIRQPWSVSVMAQESAIAALRDKDLPERTRKYISEEKALLYRGFDALGISYVKSYTNFILFNHRQDLKERLSEHNILIRACGNFTGLDDSYFRTAVKRDNENKMLLKALENIGGFNG